MNISLANLWIYSKSTGAHSLWGFFFKIYASLTAIDYALVLRLYLDFYIIDYRAVLWILPSDAKVKRRTCNTLVVVVRLLGGRTAEKEVGIRGIWISK